MEPRCYYLLSSLWKDAFHRTSEYRCDKLRKLGSNFFIFLNPFIMCPCHTLLLNIIYPLLCIMILKDLFRSILCGEFTFDDDAWKQVSDDAKDLICKLLVTDPDQRYTASEALASNWFSVANKRRLSQNQLEKAQSNMKTFNARLKLKVAILAAQSIARWRIVAKKQHEERMKNEQEA